MSKQVDQEHFDWNNLAEIARGPDSIVYHDPNDPNQVVKKYRYRSLEVVQAYAALTNRASDLLEKEQCYGFLSAKQNAIPLYGIDFRINPVLDIKLDQEEKPVAYSKYIPGPMPPSYGPHNSSWHWRESLATISEAEAAKLEEIRKIYTEVPHQSFAYYDLNAYFDDRLDIYKLNIETGNVKMRFNLATNRLQFIVTDLTTRFSNIHNIWPNNQPPTGRTIVTVTYDGDKQIETTTFVP